MKKLLKLLKANRPSLDRLAVLLVLVLLVSATGCVKRRLIVRSYPEGALVMIDKRPVGYSPVSVPFTYSGTREIQLEKDGYKTVQVKERIRPKLYDTFPVSLITNHLWLGELRDERLLEFQLEPREQVSESRLLDRANDLRGNVSRGTVTAPNN